MQSSYLLYKFIKYKKKSIQYVYFAILSISFQK